MSTPLIFPSNPADGQIVTATDGRSWTYSLADNQWRATAGPNQTSRLVLERYDLAVENMTGTDGDLSKQQVFIFDNTVASNKAITFSNTPVGRAMTIVFEVTGSAGSFTFTNAKIANDLTLTPGTYRTVYILFWDGAEMKVMSVTRFNNP